MKQVGSDLIYSIELEALRFMLNLLDKMLSNKACNLLTK